MKPIKDKLIARLDTALRNMYHNATPHQPRNIPQELWDVYDQWFYDQASFEVEYISDGLGMTKQEYLKQQKIGFDDNERYYWLVSRITEFGKLYTWGRGGRTLAPNDLIKMRGGSSFSIRAADNWQEYSNEHITDMIEVIEAFNRYVHEWNSKDNLAEMWKYECEYRISELKEEAKTSRQYLKKLAVECKALMGVAGETACNALKATIRSEKESHKKLIHQLTLYSA